MKTAVIIVSLCIVVLSTSAQVSDTYYFNNDYQLLPSKTDAAFTAMVRSDSAVIAPGNYHYEVYNASGNLIYYNNSEHFLLQNSDSIILYFPDNKINKIYYYSASDTIQKEESYTREGVLKMVKTYKNGETDSIFYYENGSLHDGGIFRNGKYTQAYYVETTGVKNFTSEPHSAPYHVEADMVFKIVEVMPVFPGGEQKMYEYLGKTIRYPRYATQHNIEGKVYLNFIVNKEGEITMMNIAKGIHPLLDFETMHAVNIMSAWSPGKQEGQVVNVDYTLPVLYKLQK